MLCREATVFAGSGWTWVRFTGSFRDAYGKTADGIQFFVRGLRLLGSDISHAGQLFTSAALGGPQSAQYFFQRLQTGWLVCALYFFQELLARPGLNMLLAENPLSVLTYCHPSPAISLATYASPAHPLCLAGEGSSHVHLNITAF